jgi:phospholipid/cholesterol/gamma-HCH transport system permease protein
VALVFGRALASLPRLQWRELLRTVSHFGFDSLPLIAAVALLTGLTVVVQAHLYVRYFNARQFVGWAAGYAIFWEFGPLLLGLMLATRTGAKNAAELAVYRTAGQLEGLEGIGVDPLPVVVAPRLFGLLAAGMLLSSITFLLAIACEAVASQLFLDLPWRAFALSFQGMLSWRDVAAGLTKCFAFALAISVLSTTAGLTAEGGAEGVGRAAARAVVSSAGAVFALDFLLTAALTGGS